jgi:hypothetical protein
MTAQCGLKWKQTETIAGATSMLQNVMQECTAVEAIDRIEASSLGLGDEGRVLRRDG